MTDLVNHGDFLGTSKFEVNDQIEFSRFSGDYNPMHIDPVKARRLLYGETVVHGINGVLVAFEKFSEHFNKNFLLNSINVFFPNPIFLNTTVEYYFTFNKKNGNLNFKVISKSLTCISINSNIQFISKIGNNIEGIKNDFPNVKTPNKVVKENINNLKGSIELFLKLKILENSFPMLKSTMSNHQISIILSLTRLVGMQCPGLYSVFSHFKIKFNCNNTFDSNYAYNVDKFDNRFSLVNINLDSSSFNGKIKAFLRSPPVKQPDYLLIKDKLKNICFNNQVALIIGGSRGAGEVTAKILASAGAIVIITYNKGGKDAQMIIDEINSNGGLAYKIKLDILNFNKEFNSDILNKMNITHCYYFATPFIFSGKKGLYSDDLFNNFSTFYISAFYNIVNYFYRKDVNNFFYPSTVAVDDIPDNMLEYSLAKLAGEKMCNKLESDFKSISIYKPRLPRLETDQTVSFLPVNNEDTLEVMIKHLKQFC